MSNLLCTVCHQTSSYDNFLAQHCGHVFCRDCMAHLNRERKCPTCRREWESIVPFRLYLNFPESDKFGQILHHLENIDESSSTFLLERMSGAIQGFVENPENLVRHDTVTRLLEAALRLEQRVVPIASELEKTRQENETLHQQLKDTDAQLKSKENFEEALTADLERLNRTVFTMCNELAYETQKRQSEQNTSRRLSRSLRKKQEEVKTKAQEVLSLRFEIEEHEKQMRLMKSKLRALTKLTRPRDITDKSADNSLIVE